MIKNYRLVVISIAAIITAILVLFLMCFGIPALSRYQDLANANNNVKVSSIEIQNTKQLVEVEQQKAQVRVAEAKGIAESQKIIDSSLTENYLQYMAIKAQEKMANSTNHTEVYIPSGANGIPLVKIPGSVGEIQNK
jgi:F0F1-type ATP synthase membrane subunit b/b'